MPATTLARGLARHSATARHCGKRRALASMSSGAMPVPQRHHPRAPTIADLVDRARPAVAVSTDSSVLDAAHAMADERASMLFVEDSGFLVGIVGETELIEHADKSGGDLSSRVSDVMRDNIAFARPACTMRASLELLQRTEQDYLPFLRNSEAASGAFDDTGSANVPSGRVRMRDVTHVISVKQLLGQFYLEHVGDVSENDADERFRLENEAAAALGLPNVKTLLKAKRERSEAKGELGTMVLNTLAEDNITVAETIRQMQKFNKGSVAIMERCRDAPVLVGIATEQDVVRRAMARGLDLGETRIVDVMSRKDLSTVTSRDGILTCAYRMVRDDIRHLPVVSSKGEHCLAIVSAGDIVDYLCKAVEDKQ